MFELFDDRSEPIDVDFLGVRTRRAFQVVPQECITTGLPPADQDYLEWISVLEAVAGARGAFTMIELGAGWGRWLVRAAAALRRLGDLPYRLVGVEAEPTHFAWLRQHMRENGIDLSRCELHQAAVAPSQGEAVFLTGNAGRWYGQRIVEPAEVSAHTGDGVGAVVVPTVTLSSLLADTPAVDLLDIDIQGAELDVLTAAKEEVDTRVRRVFIGTHSADLEAGLRELFAGLGWDVVFNYGCGSTRTTPWGRMSFVDGVQSWTNPRLGHRARDAATANLPNTGATAERPRT